MEYRDYGVWDNVNPPLDPPLVKKLKDKLINLQMDVINSVTIILLELSSITLDCFIRVHWDNIQYSLVTLTGLWKPVKCP